MMLGRQVREKTDAELRNQGLSLRHLSALGHLAHQPGLSYSELARRDGITAQSMQSTLLQLQEIGAVERLTAPGRGRTADLQVTESGLALLDRGRAVLRAADQRLLDAIGNENGELITRFAFQALIALKDWDPS
jgi:DNA-binding MarR family transcriptional regulator